MAQGGAARDFSLQDFAGRAWQEGPATIYTAREFITMDPNKPRAEAVAVRDGKIFAVGTRAEVGAAVGRNAPCSFPTTTSRMISHVRARF